MAILLKQYFPTVAVTVFEQNPRGATFGFGVVFSDRALDFMQADAPALFNLIAPVMQSWENMTLSLPARDVILDGVGFSAIGRLQLLELLEGHAAKLGVQVMHDCTITDLTELRGDLVIGADGVNSIVRESNPNLFEPSVSYSRNRFAWFGVAKRFDTLTQTFIETPCGPMNAHHYRYTANESTFIVECSDETWRAHGFDKLNQVESAAKCTALFEKPLEGAELVTNASEWRVFPHLWCERWVSGTKVLLGDAAHTAHFSIGSGTRLAMEDAIALVSALRHAANLEAGLGAYERSRQPIARKIVDAARASADWYEDFGAIMKLPALEFAKRYLMRSGRLNVDQLRKLAPRFMSEYDVACH